jgi:two-component system sensor histidine kinase/response regulator
MPVQAGASTADDSAGQPKGWQRALHIARPLVITILAAAAFAALLRFHHSRFEEGLVRTFQRQQMDATRSLAAFIGEHFDGVSRNLALLAGKIDVRNPGPSMDLLLSSCLNDQGNMLSDLAVLDTSGAPIWKGASLESAAQSAGPQLTIRVPVEADGEKVAELCAHISVQRIASRCLSQPSTAYKSIMCLITSTGEVIDGSGPAYAPRTVVDVLRTAEGPKQHVGNTQLLNYVMDNCAIAGESGLAEVVNSQTHQDELVAFTPIAFHDQRLALAIGSPRAVISVPISSHERVTYALIAALALLYFATGYVAYRSERATIEAEKIRRHSAESASQAKGEFLAQMSHEIRTPMNGIIGMTELAIMSDAPDERQKYLGIVKECANSLLLVINDILDVSKIEAGKLRLSPTTINLPDCIANTLAPLISLASNKGLAVEWDIAPEVPAIVLADGGRLRQILTNLVGNAVKFTSAGKITVTVKLQGLQTRHVVLLFSVKDTGPGMSAEEQKRVFVPYDQCNNREAYRTDGTGLGLSIAKQLIEHMHGRIWIESQAGLGATFNFTVRLGRMGEMVQADARVLPVLAGTSTLVISNVPENLRRFAGLLESWGAMSQTCRTTQDGLRALGHNDKQAQPFSLVLLDGSDATTNTQAFADDFAKLRAGLDIALAVVYPPGLRGDSADSLHASVDAYLTADMPDAQLHTALRMALQNAAGRKNPLSQADAAAPDQHLRILLVDDNPVNLMVASLLLGKLGHQVRSASSGQEAIDAAGLGAFDLVLMDLEMPGMNGLQATAGIRKAEAVSGKRVPIVAMTAHALDSDRQRCLQAGMDDFISKPVRPELLRKLIGKFSPITAQQAGSEQASPPTASLQNVKVWDKAEALRFTDGDESTLAKTIEVFLGDLKETLPKAQESAMVTDKAALAAMAHRLKSSLGILAATRAVSAAVELEQACSSNGPERVLECFERLNTELAAVQQALIKETKEISETTKCTS